MHIEDRVDRVEGCSSQVTVGVMFTGVMIFWARRITHNVRARPLAKSFSGMEEVYIVGCGSQVTVDMEFVNFGAWQIAVSFSEMEITMEEV